MFFKYIILSKDYPILHSQKSFKSHLSHYFHFISHQQRSNIPCHLQDISCGLVCDKPLPCGSHHCKKICHRGECQAEGECKQPCTYPRPSCGHPCAAPCHPGTPCPPTICSAKVKPFFHPKSTQSVYRRNMQLLLKAVLCFLSCSLIMILSIPQLQGACGLAHAYRQTYIIGYVKCWKGTVNYGFHKHLLQLFITACHNLQMICCS